MGNQPYDSYMPRTQFLQPDKVWAHRSALGVVKERESHMLGGDTRIMHATTTRGIENDAMQPTVYPELNTDSKEEVAIWRYLMTQDNLKPGLRKFREQGIRAAVLELTQLHMMDTWAVMDPCSLTKEVKSKVLSLLLYSKEKRCGKVKGQMCINGAPQRAYIPKENTALLTVSAKSASKKRHVQCYNVSSVANTDMDKNMLMVLKGELAKMMVHIAPQIYRKHIVVDKRGSLLLHVKLQKALYGLMRASLLFYRKLRQKLEAFGFLVSPYNLCIANKDMVLNFKFSWCSGHY